MHEWLLGRRSVLDDVCALPLVRRVAALLDTAPEIRSGGVLPRGWHIALFTPTARQSRLGHDGLPQEDTLLPNPDPVSLPRKVLGGRRTFFKGDLHVGANVRRDSEIVAVTPKDGQTGRLLLVTVRSNIFEEGASEPAIIEEQDSLFREAPTSSGASIGGAPGARAQEKATIRRSIVFDTTMLFRYSAITFNTHRIHFDYPYVTEQEKYRGLLVNGGFPALLLLELAREQMGREPNAVTARNIRPLYCGEAVFLCGTGNAHGWALWAESASGQRVLDVMVS